MTDAPRSSVRRRISGESSFPRWRRTPLQGFIGSVSAVVLFGTWVVLALVLDVGFLRDGLPVAAVLLVVACLLALRDRRAMRRARARGVADVFR